MSQTGVILSFVGIIWYVAALGIAGQAWRALEVPVGSERYIVACVLGLIATVMFALPALLWVAQQ